jgi:hypothetical protein
MSKIPLFAHLNLDEGSDILPFWLDYHRFIFAGCFLSGAAAREDNTIHLVRKFCPDWQIAHSDTMTSHALTPNDFVLHSGDLDAEFELDTLDTLRKYYAGLKCPNAHPKNTIDFLSNIKDVREDSGAVRHFPENDNVSILSFRFSSDTKRMNCMKTPEHDNIMRWIDERIKAFKQTDYIYYVEPYADCDWGEDRVILAEDVNLLGDTDFNADGHKVLSLMSSATATTTAKYNGFWKRFVEERILEITSRPIAAEQYHNHISDEEHKQIINRMPYKKTDSPELLEFAQHMESRVSEIVGKKVKIFNDDLWVRICRPSCVGGASDYNPCHRDVYLDFYRNIVNIYVPIVGSNELSSLTMQSGSHLWNERDIMVTRGGAHFKNSGKKYSVDAVVQSRRRLTMSRPNPNIDEFILFSPYLIHGCSDNANADITRMSVEVRFIQDTEQGRKQEAAFNAFLKSRVWR